MLFYILKINNFVRRDGWLYEKKVGIGRPLYRRG
jgi:hypothetical protein